MAADRSIAFHWADYVVFVAFLVVSAAIGIIYGIRSRRNASAKDFLTGGGQMHFLPVALSMMASFLSAVFILGIPTEFYFYGTTYAYLMFSYVIGYPVAAFLYLPVFHKLRVTSGYEYLEKRFDNKVRVAASMTFSLQMILYMPVVLYAPSLAISQVTDLTTEISIVSVGLVCTFYTALGGMRATVWNDAFQMLIVLTGFSLLLGLGADSVGGLDKALDIADKGGRITFGIDEFDPDPTVRTTFWTQSVGAGAVNVALFGASQATIQKFISCRSVRHGQIAVLLAGVFTGVALVLATLTGLTMYSYYETCDPLTNGDVEAGDQLIPSQVMDVMGHLHGLPGLFVATTFSASLSTISGGLNALAAVFLEDLIKPLYRRCQGDGISNTASRVVSRVVATTLGFGTIGLAFLAPVLGDTVIQIALSVFGMIGGPLCGVVTLGLFFPCCNAIGALCGLLVSITLTCWIGFGAIIAEIPVPRLPLRTDGCDASLNATATVTTATATAADVTALLSTSETPPQGSDALWIYKISYLYYGVVAIATCILVAIPVSLVTGGNKVKNDELYFPLQENCFCYCSKSCLAACQCDLGKNKDEEEIKKQEVLETENRGKSDGARLSVVPLVKSHGGEFSTKCDDYGATTSSSGSNHTDLSLHL